MIKRTRKSTYLGDTTNGNIPLGCLIVVHNHNGNRDNLMIEVKELNVKREIHPIGRRKKLTIVIKKADISADYVGDVTTVRRRSIGHERLDVTTKVSGHVPG
jgi:hypothetical protein